MLEGFAPGRRPDRRLDVLIDARNDVSGVDALDESQVLLCRCMLCGSADSERPSLPQIKKESANGEPLMELYLKLGC